MSFFLNLSTKAKLLISFMVVILINLVISVTTISSLHTIHQNSVVIDDVLNNAFTRIHKAQEAVENIKSKFSMGLNVKEPTYSVQQLKNDANELLGTAQRTVNAIKPDFLGTEEYRNSCIALQQNTRNAIAIIQKDVLPLMQAGKTEDAFNNFMNHAAGPLGVAAKTASSIFKQQNNYCIGLTEDSADSNITLIAIICTIIGAIVAIFLALSMSNYISRSLIDQNNILEAIKNGDFSLHIHEGYQDEFGKSHDMIRDLRNTLSDIIYMTQEESRRLKGEMTTLQGIAQNMSQVSSNIQNQAITVAAASDEMVSTTTDIARNCETAAAGSDLCKSISNAGLSKVEQAVQNIRQQSEHTKDNAHKIENLARQSRDIGSIVSTIDDIAAQTNLLALNAAIEAARAGEAGRGFAVVADEVRALASRTSQSTQEISKMVKSIQADAAIATDSINASVENMDTVATDAQNIVHILNDITEHVNNVNTQITQIATAAEEQTAATSEISAHMQSVTTVAADMSNDADSQFKAMAEATDDLDKLLKALSYFKIRDPKTNQQTH